MHPELKDKKILPVDDEANLTSFVRQCYEPHCEIRRNFLFTRLQSSASGSWPHKFWSQKTLAALLDGFVISEHRFRRRHVRAATFVCASTAAVSQGRREQ
jgi:hypothetical protein